MRKFVTLFAVLSVLALAVFPAFAQDEEMEMGTIADAVVAATEGDAPEFTVLLAAVQAADPMFLEALSDEEAELTVFAPTDAAFVALLEELEVEAEDLLADTELLNEVLAYHVVPAVAMAEDVVEIAGENGDYVDTLADYDPVFVQVMVDEETEEATVMVDEATVVAADAVEASNGVVHVIDSVLIPDGTPTIADIVVSMASMEEGAEFTTLLAAVQAADPSVIEALSDPEAELTVFAPTDEAFGAALEALGVEAADLLADTETLTSILTYHVVAGKLMAEDVVEAAGDMGADVETLNGATFNVMVTEDGVVINESINVVVTDVEATNGVIHVIDFVMVPPAGE